jgi:hypothetical protein
MRLIIEGPENRIKSLGRELRLRVKRHNLTLTISKDKEKPVQTPVESEIIKEGPKKRGPKKN